MTEKEKALGYLQMLKNEGHLDEEALVILKEMYELKSGEAEAILEEFKTMPEYHEGIAKNIKSQSGTLLFLLIGALCFAFAAYGRNGFGAFSYYSVFYLLLAYVILRYILKLLDERYEITGRYTWIKNPALPLLIFGLIAFLFNQYKLESKSYLVSPVGWVKLDSMVIEKNISEVNTNGSSLHPKYEIQIGNYFEPFIWYSDDHLYCFKPGYPDKLISKGDTVSLWVQKTMQDGSYASTFNKVWDIEKNGIRFLDINQRNIVAKEQQEKNRTIYAVILAISAAAFLYFGRNNKAQ